MSLSALDWFIMIVLAGGLVRGMMVGAVRQVTSLAGILAAFFVSVQFMRPVGDLIVESLGLAGELAPVVGFVTLFVGVQLLFMATSRLVEQILDTLNLTIANRLAGGAVGGFKAALLLSILFLVLASVEIPGPDVRSKSQLYAPVATVLPETWDTAATYVPQVKRVSDQFGARVRHTLRSNDGAAPVDSSATNPPPVPAEPTEGG
jgi:membrane protein required for colicin V production